MEVFCENPTIFLGTLGEKNENSENLGPVWYMCLKTENCCLKSFVEIRVGEKVCENA